MFFRLSECFPATQSTIAKIVKKKKYSIHPNAIQKHDLNVRNNWAKLLDGQLEVSGNLMRHLVSHMKFFLYTILNYNGMCLGIDNSYYFIITCTQYSKDMFKSEKLCFLNFKEQIHLYDMKYFEHKFSSWNSSNIFYNY